MAESDLVINFEEAYQLALLKQKESNLARCYLVLYAKYLLEIEEN